MARKSFAGGAQDTTLSSDITAAATTIAVTDGSSYPDGSVGPFAIRLDAGTPNEEKVLVATRTGNTLNGCTRGFDGSTAVSHNAPAPVEHILDADTLDDLSDHVYDTTRDDHTQYLTAARGNAAYAPLDHMSRLAIIDSATAVSIGTAATDIVASTAVPLPAGWAGMVVSVGGFLRFGSTTNGKHVRTFWNVQLGGSDVSSARGVSFDNAQAVSTSRQTIQPVDGFVGTTFTADTTLRVSSGGMSIGAAGEIAVDGRYVYVVRYRTS